MVKELAMTTKVYDYSTFKEAENDIIKMRKKGWAPQPCEKDMSANNHRYIYLNGGTPKYSVDYMK